MVVRALAATLKVSLRTAVSLSAATATLFVGRCNTLTFAFGRTVRASGAGAWWKYMASKKIVQPLTARQALARLRNYAVQAVAYVAQRIQRMRSPLRH
eukprot:6199011-Pleurochrysis_carterae.AAC.1